MTTNRGLLSLVCLVLACAGGCWDPITGRDGYPCYAEGDLSADDACPDGYVCSPENACTNGSICGDQVVGASEECDENEQTATCDADCTLPACGDGVFNELAEECDASDPEYQPPYEGAACLDDCTLAN